ncbi:MAG: HAD family hydrolase [Verrucomicrobiales bacterium]|nr:HAD family hydrolase [Verrucomicrobiales bacterium]|tara:strand:- start:90 stop:683 length:594 start_codon:yes stop_codon:yes gene_type:complete
MEPRGLIFDCDGTLADSMPLHWRAWDQTCRKHGLVFTEERFYSLGGVPSRRIFAMLGEEQGVALDPVELSRQKEAAYLPLMPELQPVEPIVTIAREHRGKVPMAVATGGMRNCITQILNHLGIADWFDALVTSEDVENPKPAPDTFVKAAQQIGVAPEHCRAFEDTDLGMQAIRAAGMEAVDVRTILGVKTGSAFKQ